MELSWFGRLGQQLVVGPGVPARLFWDVLWFHGYKTKPTPVTHHDISVDDGHIHDGGPTDYSGAEGFLPRSDSVAVLMSWPHSRVCGDAALTEPAAQR